MSDVVDWPEDDRPFRGSKPAQRGAAEPKKPAPSARESAKPREPQPAAPQQAVPQQAARPQQAAPPKAQAAPKPAPDELFGSVPGSVRALAYEAARSRGMAPGAWVCDVIERAAKDAAKPKEAAPSGGGKPRKPANKTPKAAKAKPGSKSQKRAAKPRAERGAAKKGVAKPLLARLFGRR